MRDSYSNIIDNLSSRMDRKIDKKILMETIQNYSPEDRDGKKYKKWIVEIRGVSDEKHT